MQIVMGQIQGHIAQAVTERLTPLAQTLGEMLTRIKALEDAHAALVEDVKTSRESVSDLRLFDPEERRILILNSAGFYDKKDIKNMWEKYKSSKVEVSENVGEG